MSNGPKNDEPIPAEEEDGFEPFREIPVGTNDPNIVGDVDAFDKPPGSDPKDEGELEE
jgi:hypothetical protein